MLNMQSLMKKNQLKYNPRNTYFSLLEYYKSFVRIKNYFNKLLFSSIHCNADKLRNLGFKI